jgi:Zn-dependent protease with chaperone function
MKQLYRFLPWVLAALALGCAPRMQHEAFYQVDEPFVQFIHAFEQASALQGQPIRIDDLIVSFGSTPTMNETGICEWAEYQTPRVTLNERIWKNLTDDDREEVIFHELGHCLLRRVHHTGEVHGYAGDVRIPESVMFPYRIDGQVYRDHLDHYHAELFDLNKRNQF